MIKALVGDKDRTKVFKLRANLWFILDYKKYQRGGIKEKIEIWIRPSSNKQVRHKVGDWLLFSRRVDKRNLRCVWVKEK